MKLKTSLLSLLILGSLSVLGFREHPSQEFARRAVCVVRCNEEFHNGTSVPHPEDCLDECSTHPRHIPVIEIEAKANIQYMCHRDESSVFLRMNPGVFIVEFRNQSSDWIDDKMVFNDGVYGTYNSTSYKDGPYQLRFTRVLVDGISNPETTDWFKALEPDLRSEERLDVRLHCLSVYSKRIMVFKNAYLTAHIVSIPGGDVACAYNIMCSEAGGTYNQTKRITFFRRDMEEVTFEDLRYAANFTVTVWDDFSSTRHSTGIEFSTPLSEDERGPKKICVPDEVADIEASASSYKDGNIHDVYVTWRTPKYVPDYFIVNITTDGAESNGTQIRSHNDREIRSFNTIFKDIKILQTYNVSVRGYSYLGGGPEASKRFELPQKTIGSLGSDTIIVVAVLSCMSLVVIIGVRVYFMRRRKRLTQKKTKVSSMDDWEIDPGRLVVSRVLGSGAFGIVKLGKLRDNEGRDTDVAVKMLRDNTNKTERRYFFLEIEMMKSLGSHPNIVSFLDYRTVGLYPFLVLEYCPRGDLLAFLHSVLFATPSTPGDQKEEPRLSGTGTSEQGASLQQNSEGLPATPEFSSVRSNPSILLPGMESREPCGRSLTASLDVGGLNDTFVPDRDATLTVLDMLNFGRQIATGMEFLSSNRIVHCDLAARNVLLCDDRVLKISDFGLSRDIYLQNIYRKTGNGRMPLKWMAIESLTHQVFTTCSDVWSFGILLWEIFTLGGTPYPDVPAIELLKVLQSGYRMKRPENCSEAQYNLMLACWKSEPKNRPTFTYLREELDKLICMASDNECFDMDDLSLGAPCIEKNPETSSTTSSSYDTSF